MGFLVKGYTKHFDIALAMYQYYVSNKAILQVKVTLKIGS